MNEPRSRRGLNWIIFIFALIAIPLLSLGIVSNLKKNRQLETVKPVVDLYRQSSEKLLNTHYEINGVRNQITINTTEDIFKNSGKLDDILKMRRLATLAAETLDHVSKELHKASDFGNKDYASNLKNAVDLLSQANIFINQIETSLKEYKKYPLE